MLQLILAHNIDDDGSSDHALRLIDTGDAKALNVDISTVAGLERARSLDLLGREYADALLSTLLYPSSTLLVEQSEHPGRMFTLIRHPVERAVSLFHYIQDTQWRNKDTFQKELSELTLE